MSSSVTNNLPLRVVRKQRLLCSYLNVATAMQTASRSVP